MKESQENQHFQIPVRQIENNEANPKQLSYFASNFSGGGFQESSKNLPTSDIDSVDEKIKSQIDLGSGNYLDITKYDTGYRFTFRFLTSAKDSLRKGGCAGISLYFEKYIPNPVVLIQSVQEALAGFKKDNYESTALPDGRLILGVKDFQSMKAPVILLSTKDSKKIPDTIDNIKRWFVETFNEELQK
ncbi:MAG: hypothetical protein WCG55_03095 [bacterium]